MINEKDLQDMTKAEMCFAEVSLDKDDNLVFEFWD